MLNLSRCTVSLNLCTRSLIKSYWTCIALRTEDHTFSAMWSNRHSRREEIPQWNWSGVPLRVRHPTEPSTDPPFRSPCPWTKVDTLLLFWQRNDGLWSPLTSQVGSIDLFFSTDWVCRVASNWCPVTSVIRYFAQCWKLRVVGGLWCEGSSNTDTLKANLQSKLNEKKWKRKEKTLIIFLHFSLDQSFYNDYSTKCTQLKTILTELFVITTISYDKFRKKINMLNNYSNTLRKNDLFLVKLRL